MNSKTCKLGAAACRWTARIIGTILVALTLTIAIGEGMPNPFTQPYWIQAGFLGLALILVGILAGWLWEIPGSLVSLGGWSLFAVVVVLSPRGMTSFVLCLALPGLLYLASALLRRLADRPPAAS